MNMAKCPVLSATCCKACLQHLERKECWCWACRKWPLVGIGTTMHHQFFPNIFGGQGRGRESRRRAELDRGGLGPGRGKTAADYLTGHISAAFAQKQVQIWVCPLALQQCYLWQGSKCSLTPRTLPPLGQHPLDTAILYFQQNKMKVDFLKGKRICFAFRKSRFWSLDKAEKNSSLESWKALPDE